MDKFIYIVKDYKGSTQAIFMRRWQAEEFAEKYNYPAVMKLKWTTEEDIDIYETN